MGLSKLLDLVTGVNWSRLLSMLLIPIAIFLLLGGLYLAGVRHGESLVQVKWDQDKNQRQAELSRAQGAITQKEAEHRQETAEISEQLRKTEAQHETTVAALSAEHAQRMRESSDRAAVYQHLAEAGAAECRGLASHAAELDRSLEEGRGLVGELREALGQREDQLRLLGAQIVSDRKLVDGQ